MNWATYIKFMNKIEMFTRKKENTGDLFDRKHNSMTLVVLLLIQASVIV